jgi:hypothetical protein
MRVVSVLVGLLFLVGAALAQVPSFKREPVGTLAQLMRGINFHSSNLLFEAQTKEITSIDASPGTTYSGIYAGWPAVENAAVALAEAADLLMIPGRVCENGRPVPMQRADWVKYAEGLRQAGRAALKVAQSKNRDAMIEITNEIAGACENCHAVYRDVPGGMAGRCVVN